MLNRKPIFVNGFSRGGTTIFTNLLASHPDVCTVPEIHHLFKGHNVTDSAARIAYKCLFHDVPVLLSTCQDFFSPRLLVPRCRPSRRLQRFIDRVIFKEKLRCRNSYFNQFKARQVEYTRQEIASSRLVGKCIDGMVYTTDTFAEMYPDATFVGLVRNGLALCEGHLRRGRPAHEIGQRYRELVAKMQADAVRLPHYRLMRFEDLLSDTAGCLHELYEHARLDISKLSSVRMQVRRVMTADGNHQLVGGLEWDVIWLDPASLESYFRHDVNDNQIKRLAETDRDSFLAEAGSTMEQLGYSTDQAHDDEPQVLAFPRAPDTPAREAA